MNPFGASQFYKAYGNDALETAVLSATPVQLVVMLYDGAITALAKAQGEIQHRNYAGKGRLITKAVDIIEGLRVALDFSKGGDIAVSLNDLYEYMNYRLAVANLHNDAQILQEIQDLLRELREAWDHLSKNNPFAAAALPTDRLSAVAESTGNLNFKA